MADPCAPVRTVGRSRRGRRQPQGGRLIGVLCRLCGVTLTPGRLRSMAMQGKGYLDDQNRAVSCEEVPPGCELHRL